LPAQEMVLPDSAKAPQVWTKKQHFYVSYAWADPTDPRREMDVDRLCEEAEKRGALIVRDKSTLKIGDFIYDFMQQIGEGDRVFVFLSNKYLRSPYCMFELFELWRNSRQDKTDFAGKIRVFATDGTRIGTPDEWLDYTAYWVAERDRLKLRIDQVGWSNAGQEVLRRYRYMEDFATKISDVLALFTDVVQPKTFDEFLKYGFDDPPGGARIH
jgi:internalin A